MALQAYQVYSPAARVAREALVADEHSRLARIQEVGGSAMTASLHATWHGQEVALQWLVSERIFRELFRRSLEAGGTPTADMHMEPDALAGHYLDAVGVQPEAKAA